MNVGFPSALYRRVTDYLGSRRARGFEPQQLLFLALVCIAALPLWATEHLPLQDLPQHLAAVAVLRHYSNPDFGFAEFFRLSLFETQYLTYYLIVDAFAQIFRVELANRIVLTVVVCGTPLALRRLLVSLGREPSWALFALPLTYSVHLILGFLNFVAALPLCLWGLSLAVEERLAPRRRRALGLAVLGLVLFLTHVVPFAFWLLGVFLIALGDDLKRTALRLAPALPSLGVALIWSGATAAGGAVLGALGLSNARAVQAEYQDWSVSLRELPSALTDVQYGAQDDVLLGCFGILIWLTLALGLGSSEAEPDRLRLSLSRRLALLSPLAVAAYFVSPTAYEWIWPINWRFPVIAALFLPLILPALAGIPRAVVLACVSLLSLLSFLQIGAVFHTVERDELGQLEQALAHIPPRQKVAGLIWERTSILLKYAPFLHVAALYQVRKGGVAMFTFAEFPQSPFRFKPEAAPPKVRARWEWRPDLVDPARELLWYDYALVRGGPGPIANFPELWESTYRDAIWSVWRRRSVLPLP